MFQWLTLLVDTYHLAYQNAVKIEYKKGIYRDPSILKAEMYCSAKGLNWDDSMEMYEAAKKNRLKERTIP